MELKHFSVRKIQVIQESEVIVCTCKMSLCLCKVCINAALCDEAPGVFVYSAILSLTAVSCKKKDERWNWYEVDIKTDLKKLSSIWITWQDYNLKYQTVKLISKHKCIIISITLYN